MNKIQWIPCWDPKPLHFSDKEVVLAEAPRIGVEPLDANTVKLTLAGASVAVDPWVLHKAMDYALKVARGKYVT